MKFTPEEDTMTGKWNVMVEHAYEGDRSRQFDTKDAAMTWASEFIGATNIMHVFVDGPNGEEFIDGDDINEED